jgi:hypothetical protein
LKGTPISGNGTMLNCAPGSYTGTLYYNSLEDLSRSKYLLECVIDTERFRMKLLPQNGEKPKAVFDTQINDSNKEFKGILEFN